MEAAIVGVSFAIEPGEAAYVPLLHDYLGAPEQLSRERGACSAAPAAGGSQAAAKLGQNLKYDANVLANHGIALRRHRATTRCSNPTCSTARRPRHDMDTLALKYLDRQTIHYEDVAGKGAKQITFSQVELERPADYAAEDADITLRLHQALWPQLEAEPRLRGVFEDIEMPLVPVLSRIERTGALVDVELLASRAASSATRMLEIEGARARGRRTALQPRLAEADAGNPVRQARPAGDRERPRTASPRPPKPCCRNWPRLTSCRA